MKGKCIGIIGASGIIGSAVARELDSCGFRLGLHYCTNATPIDELLSVSTRPREHCIHRSSLNNLAEGQRTLDSFKDQLGELHGLALCAGRVPWKNEDQLTSQDWSDATFELSAQPYSMALYFSKICAPKSRIIALSSISAKYGGSTKSRHYGAAKAALESCLTGLSRSLSHRNICVNIVRAGFIVTPQQTKGRTPNEIEQRIQKIPFGRAGCPDEVASLFSFLFSPKSAFLTGQCITMSGGD